MIPLLAARTLSRLRYGPPTMSGGVPTRPAPVETELIASVQYAPAQVMEHMPDGTDSSSTIVVLTYGTVRASFGGDYADVVRVPAGLDVEAGEYEVHKVERSPAFLSQPASDYAVCVRVRP